MTGAGLLEKLRAKAMRLTYARCIRGAHPPILHMLSKGTNVSVKVETLVLFGATGDLAQRMLFPSLYNLHLDGLFAGEPEHATGHRRCADQSC